MSMSKGKEKIFEEKTGTVFKEVYKKIRTRLVYHLFKYSKDTSTAEEIADDSIVKALNIIETYDPEKAQFSTWLFTIGCNKMKQHLKKQSKLESIEGDENEEGVSKMDKIDQLITTDYDTEGYENVLAKKVELVKKGIRELPKIYSNILKMRELDKLSYQEILDVVDDIDSINTVKSRILQGRKLLRKRLGNKMKQLDEYGV